MSWKASAWAKEQRLGSPAAKSILLCLADYADPEKGECWPSQAQLSADAEVSERTAREWLQRLEDWGLIGRSRRNRPSGARASDLIRLNLDRKVVDGVERCREIRDEAEAAEESLPAETAGRTYRQPDAEPTGNQAQPTGNGCRASIEEPPIEPPYGTSQQGAQARERGDFDDPKKFEARVKRMAEGWPGWANSSTAWAVRQFAALTDAERAEAERCRAGYLAHCGNKALSVGTYLAEKKWLDLPAQALAAADPSARPQLAAPFGKLWGAKRMALLIGAPPQPAPPATGFLAAQLADAGEAGQRARLERQARYGWPGVNRMDELAAQAKPWPLAAVEAAALERLAQATEQVWTGTPLWDAWRDEFARRGWPWLPEMGRQRVASFPAGGPEGLEAFERAVREGGEGGAGGFSEARKAG